MSGNLGAPPVPPPGSVIAPTAATLAVTTTSSVVQLPNPTNLYPFVNLLNDGSAELFFSLGQTSSVTASTTTSIPLPAGKCLSVWAGPNTYVAAIGSSATTLRITQSNGPACPR